MISSKATLLLIHRTYFIFTTLYKQEVVCWLTGIHTHTGQYTAAEADQSAFGIYHFNTGS